MNNKLWLVGILGFVLAACATTRAYEHSLEAWQGRTESEVVQKWGAPTQRVALADGGRSLVYIRHDAKSAKFTRDPASGKTIPYYDCRTSFVLSPDDGKVVGWKYDGANCRQ